MAAPTYSETLDTMYATTWQIRQKTVTDQIFNATPLDVLMTQKGKKDTQTGGRWIEQPLNYEKNETVTYIARGGSVSLSATDPITMTHWDWKYQTGHIIRYFADFQQNRGKAQLINKVNADIDNLRDSMIDGRETAMFGDGTGDSGKAIDGLGNIVAIAPGTGTVAGLNRATYSWWRNNYKSMTGENVSVYLVKRMLTMFNDCGKLGQGISRFPDILVCAQNVHEAYEEETAEIGRILMGNKTIADLGFGESAYKGRPITWSPSCPDGYLYFLNTNYLKYTTDPIEDMNLGKFLDIIDQPRDVVAHSMSVGNMTSSNCKKQGVIFLIAP